MTGTIKDGVPVKGEVGLADHGVLVLDDAPEFKRGTLMALREPLGTGKITISRGDQTERMMAGGLLIATMEPCSCLMCPMGNKKGVPCATKRRMRWNERIAGTIGPYIDLIVHTDEQPVEKQWKENSDEIRQRVEHTHNVQRERANAGNEEAIHRTFDVTDEMSKTALGWLHQESERLSLTEHRKRRTARVARTIADLKKSVRIAKTHVEEALSLYDPAFDITEED